MWRILIVLAWCLSALAQPQSNTAARNPRYVNANVTAGTSVPSSCLSNQIYVKTDATAGANVYACVLGAFVQQGTAGSGSGDVVGPAKAGDGNLAVFDSTTGKLLKDGGAPPTGVSGNEMTQAVANSVDNSVSVGVGTSGRAFEKTPVTIDPSTGAIAGAASITTGDGTIAGEQKVLELTANGSNYRSWLAPDALTASVQLKHPDAAPAASIMAFPTPTGTVSQYSWIGYAEAATVSTIPVRDSGGNVIVAAEAYDATNWNGDTGAPQKDAVRDKFEALAPSGVLAAAANTANNRIGSFGCTFNTVTTGTVCYVPVSFACTVTDWDVWAVGTTPTVSVDVWRHAAAVTASLPEVADEIAGTGHPTVTTANRARAAVANWTSLAITAGDIIAFSITNDVATQAGVAINCLK